MKKYKYSLILLLLDCAITLLTGCGNEKEAQTLWVVTEDSGQYGMNNIAEICMEKFNDAYPEVDFVFEELPIEEEKRESRLEQLRVEIMSGKGPDIYLLPSVNEPYESLIVDVKQSMHNGFFTDVSQYYNADDSLQKDGFKEEIMEAGVLNGKRYVLPLRFDMPIYYVDESELNKYGLTTDIFLKGIQEIYEEIVYLENSTLAKGVLVEMNKDVLNIFSELIDYEKNKVLVSREEVSSFSNLYKEIVKLSERNVGENYNEDVLTSVTSYVLNNIYWGNQNMPVFGKNLSMSDAMSLITFGKIAGKELEMFPVRSVDGSVTAEITYWTAVGANCGHPELAYEFISMFLSEEAQWETTTEKVYKENPTLVLKGWPVLVEGSAMHLWKLYRNQYRGTLYDGETGWQVRKAKFLQSTLIDEDIPSLAWEIDVVHFSADFEMQMTVEEFVQYLSWYVAEG